jgi:transcriptional regulator with XRE-family HTH domain
MPDKSPTIRRRRLAAQLKGLREASGLTMQDAAERLAISPAKLSKIENAKVSVSQADLKQMQELYGADQQLRATLLRIRKEANQKGWWEARYGDLRSPALELVGLETEANRLRVYSGLLIPGLAQIAEYTRAILRAVLRTVSLDQKEQLEDLDRLVELRMARQKVLTPVTSLVLDEAALRRPVGGSKVMRRQFEHLIEMAAADNITLQVLPHAAGEHPGMSGAFTIMSFADSADGDIVFVENPMRDLYLEEAYEIQRYALMFDQMSAAALNPEESTAFLADLAKEP